jgi:hypothetical protein
MQVLFCQQRDRSGSRVSFGSEAEVFFRLEAVTAKRSKNFPESGRSTPQFSGGVLPTRALALYLSPPSRLVPFDDHVVLRKLPGTLRQRVVASCFDFRELPLHAWPPCLPNRY